MCWPLPGPRSCISCWALTPSPRWALRIASLLLWQMLDMLREALGEDCVIYVQSIPPVRPSAAAEKPGLASDVLRGVNEQLAQLAASKGCVYLDLWGDPCRRRGNLKEMLAAPDGVHLSAGNGYGAWVTYLRNHAKYSADNSWTMGSIYSAQ